METPLKPQELRIGNLIMDEDGKICPIVSVDSEREFYQQSVDKKFIGTVSLYYGDWKGSSGRWIEKCKPIPITEEYLIRLGFQRKSRGKDFVWIHDYYMFNNVKSGWYFVFKFDGLISFCFGKLFVKEFRFVHQLQNFYFEITGDEKTFK